MALSSGFIKPFFARENFENKSPVLEVVSQTEDPSGVWLLTDGDEIGKFVFNETAGRKNENLAPGVRIILQEFHLSGNQKMKARLGIIERFLKGS